MHETPEDLSALQALLDASHAASGVHLRRIFSDERRVAAADLPGLLGGVQVTHLATVTAGGEPRVAPVDGLFYRGRLHVGTAADSQRARNIAARPQISASIAHGEEFALVLHGVAVRLDLDDPASDGLRAYYRDVYGAGWEDFRQGQPYWRLDPLRIFTFSGV